MHGLSDALLEREGQRPSKVLKEFRDFIGDNPVAGHNVRFDLRMLAAQGQRVGVEMQFTESFDSLMVCPQTLTAGQLPPR